MGIQDIKEDVEDYFENHKKIESAELEIYRSVYSGLLTTIGEANEARASSIEIAKGVPDGGDPFEYIKSLVGADDYQEFQSGPETIKKLKMSI